MAGAGGRGGAGGTGGRADAATAGGFDAGGATDLASDVPFSPIAGFGQCAVCHGPEGAGTPLGPEIQHPVTDFATWVVRNGRMHPGYMEPMPKFTTVQLTDAQLTGIFSFLAMRPKPTTGAELYKDYCQNCHGPDARGGVTMRNISTKLVADFLKHPRDGHHPGEFSNRREYMPRWTAAELSDAELRLIFQHVDSL